MKCKCGIELDYTVNGMCSICKNTVPMLDVSSNITDENIQELREIILDAGSSRNYQNKKIREWLVRYFK